MVENDQGWRRDGNQPVAGPHPDPDTSYETLHGSLDVNLQETRNKVLPARQVEQSEANSWFFRAYRKIKADQDNETWNRYSLNTQFCGSGSVRIEIILTDPDRHLGPADPDPYPFQPNVKLNYTFAQNI
jgi:hypothetical protein